MPKETRIETRLRAIDDALWAAYVGVVESARALLPRVYQTFATYTTHDYPHSHQVVSILDALMPDSTLAELHERDCFVLLAGATLHDIGMVTDTPLSGEEAEAVRRGHHAVGAQLVRTDPGRYGVPAAYASAVATTIQHHRGPQDLAAVEEIAAGNGPLLKLPLICALVRAGDALHIAEDRAPEIVIQNLDLPADSMAHFTAHRAIKGVSVRCEDAAIMVSAVAEDTELEGELSQLFGRVQDEIAALHPVLVRYGLPAFELRPQVDRAPITRHRTLLALCAGQADASEIASRTVESQTDVETALVALCGEGMAFESAADGLARTYTLAEAPNAFRKISDEILDTKDALAFVSSAYGKAMLSGPMFDRLLADFSAAYRPGDAAMRREVLCASPSAVRLALFSSQIARRSSVLSRQVLLDEAILLGLTNDVFLLPEVCQLLDLGKVTRHLGRQVGKGAPSFCRLIARAWQYRDVPLDEMRQRALAAFSGPDLPDPPWHMHMKVSWPLEPGFLSMPHLMIAARDEGVPLPIAGPELKSLEVESAHTAAQLEGGEGNRWVVFAPGPPGVQLPQLHCAARIEVDEGRYRVVLDLAGSFDDSDYPERVAIRGFLSKDEPSGMTSARHHGPCSPERALTVLSFWRTLLSGSPQVIQLVDGSTGSSFCTITTAAGPGLNEDNTHEADSVRLMEALARAHARVGEPAVVPTLMSPLQRRALLELADRIDEMSDEALSEAVRRAVHVDRPDLTLIRVVVTDPQGRRRVDECPFVFPGTPNPHPTVADPTEQAKLDALLSAGPQEIRVAYWSKRSPRDVVEEFLAGAEDGSFNPPFWPPEQDAPLQSIVEVSINPPQERYWDRLYVITLSVEAWPQRRAAFNRALVSRSEGDLETAADDLAECIVADPLFSAAHFELGRAFYDLGRLADADLSFRNAVLLGASGLNGAHALMYLGVIHLHSGDLAGALAEWERIPDQILPEILEDVEPVIDSRLMAHGHYVDACEQALVRLHQMCEREEEGT